MDREILFRAKIDPDAYSYDKKSEWVYGYYTKYSCIFSGRSVIEQENDDYAVLDKTVCQYTGITDKNGTKIFEGDILQGDEYPYCFDGDYNYYAEVVWFDDGCCGFGLCTHKNPKSTVSGISDGNCEWFEDFDGNNWSVVGNIYDNPELIEK